MMYSSYKKLRVWKASMIVTNLIYDLTSSFPKSELYGLTSQLRRAAVSIPSNIAEGSQRTSDKEFGHFIRIAKGSLAEVETQIFIAKMRKYCSNEDVEKILKETDILSRMLTRFYSKLIAQSS